MMNIYVRPCMQCHIVAHNTDTLPTARATARAAVLKQAALRPRKATRSLYAAHAVIRLLISLHYMQASMQHCRLRGQILDGARMLFPGQPALDQRGPVKSSHSARAREFSPLWSKFLAKTTSCEGVAYVTQRSVRFLSFM